MKQSASPAPDDLHVKSRQRIVQSTFIIGGSSIVTIIMRVIRAKVLAVFLGPGGIGLFSIYDSIIGLAGSVVSMGLGNSGVRQIAEANVTGDLQKISKTILCLKRVALASGIAGLIGLCILSRPISVMTFKSPLHAFDIALLSITVLCSSVAGGQTALIQGLRKIKDLAMLGIMGALLGTALSILAIYLLGEKGIALSLVTASALSAGTSWWYSRKVEVPKLNLTWPEFISEAKPLVTLGFFFMLTALMSTGSLYLSRLIIIHKLGIGPLGIYQAALALSSIYIGFILEAMGKDYYPSLTAISKDSRKYCSLINLQIEIGLLIAIPGILATMIFAPVIITLFYSTKFILAVEVLRWQILGMLLRIIIWPMAFLILAKGHGKLYLFTESFGNGISLALLWGGVLLFGLPGAGMSFLAGYLLYGALIGGLTIKKYQFRLSPVNVRLIGASLLLAASIFALHHWQNAWIISGMLLIAASIYSVRELIRIVGVNALKRRLGKFSWGKKKRKKKGWSDGVK